MINVHFSGSRSFARLTLVNGTHAYAPRMHLTQARSSALVERSSTKLEVQGSSPTRPGGQKLENNSTASSNRLANITRILFEATAADLKRAVFVERATKCQGRMGGRQKKG